MKRFALALLIGTTLAISAAAQSKGNIQGVWQLTDVTTTGPNASTKRDLQPSLYIFTKKYYSVMYVSSAAPRALIADVTKATADELRAVFIDSFIANAGTYEIKDGKLTLRPMVAKSPSYMAAGSYATLSSKLNGGTLTLVSEGGSSGPATNPTTYKLRRLE